MRLTVIIPACLLLLTISSCKRDFDCHCTTRGTRSEYVEGVRAENKEDAQRKCDDYQLNINSVTQPGIDCELVED